MNQVGLYCRAGTLLAGLALALPAGRAEAAWSEVLQDGMAEAQAAQQRLLETAEQPTPLRRRGGPGVWPAALRLPRAPCDASFGPQK